MWKRDAANHLEASAISWPKCKRVQKEIRFHNADSIAGKICYQSPKQSGEEEGIARESEAIHGGETASKGRSGKAGGNRGGGSRQTEENETSDEGGGLICCNKTHNLIGRDFVIVELIGEIQSVIYRREFAKNRSRSG